MTMNNPSLSYESSFPWYIQLGILSINQNTLFFTQYSTHIISCFESGFVEFIHTHVN